MHLWFRQPTYTWRRTSLQQDLGSLLSNSCVSVSFQMRVPCVRHGSVMTCLGIERYWWLALPQIWTRQIEVTPQFLEAILSRILQLTMRTFPVGSIPMWYFARPRFIAVTNRQLVRQMHVHIYNLGTEGNVMYVHVTYVAFIAACYKVTRLELAQCYAALV